MRSLPAIALVLVTAAAAVAQDIGGAADHPLVTRYPGQALRWQTVENFRPFRIPVGPVTGYRTIGEWRAVEGRVSRSFYALSGGERGYDEVLLNYRGAFAAAGFEIAAEGQSATRAGPQVGGRQWFDVYLAANPFTAPGDVGSMAAGTSSQGGAGSFVAFRDRAAGPVWVVVTVEQHAADQVGTLIDIVEVALAETGLVAVDPEAIGRDLAEKGRVVLDGLYFDFDRATLQPRSDKALAAVASYLAANPGTRFHVVGHSDATGATDYNLALSRARAEAVIASLAGHHGIDPARLEAHGVGPLAPVFSNASEDGRARNRRVELVERQ
ncbi:MAG: OmpA family protein [Rhodobacteraceae bacterium]|nr:OmpA family protein [Paracoccaceae bacterium]